MRAALGLLSVSALASGCYLGLDKKEDFAAFEAGVSGLDGGWSIDGSRTSDAAADTGPVDAGCSVTQLCPSSAPVCASGACTACTRHEDCAGFASTPACGGGGSCVPCTTDKKSLCSGAAPACNPQTTACVACVEDGDCPSEQAAACQSDRMCGFCTEDADCARFGRVCDSRKGACVACHPESEESDCRTDRTCDAKTADCAGTACDPKTLSCTTKTRGTVATCQACVSDSECVASHRCIPLFFGEGDTKKALGGYCMKQATTGCARPYGTPISRESLSGKSAESYCGLAEATVTCESRAALIENKTCSGMDDSCGVTGGLCKTVNFIANSCTYACRNALDCPGEIPCGGPVDATFCGGNL
jgi:hypothetical protein